MEKDEWGMMNESKNIPFLFIIPHSSFLYDTPRAGAGFASSVVVGTDTTRLRPCRFAS
jgi:hypothetical protein